MTSPAQHRRALNTRSAWRGLCSTLAFSLAIWSDTILADPDPRAPVTTADTTRAAFEQPIEGLSDAERMRFMRGRTIFHQNWVVAPAIDTAFAGLGPLYNRLSCVACHPKDGRGQPPEPGERMQSMLVRLSVPGLGAHGGPKPHPAYGDQFNEEGIPGVPGEGRVVLGWRAVRHRSADGTVVELAKPVLKFESLAYGKLDGVLTSPRVGPQVYGLGLLDAVPAETLEAMAREKKPDGVRGRVNHVWDAAAQRSVAGRFGLKSNAPSVRQQIAGAFVGDLGITSELFPDENCTAVQTACRAAPSGGQPELTHAQLDDIEFYVAHIAPPARRDVDAPRVRQGEQLFAAIGCTACHRPQLRTDANTRFSLLAARSFAPYTDLLVHDMGPGLADGRPDYQANGREWRTPPLWGIGLVEHVNEHTRFLHDGRARNLDEAVRWHDGEAHAARTRFERLGADARAALIAFLESL